MPGYERQPDLTQQIRKLQESVRRLWTRIPPPPDATDMNLTVPYSVAGELSTGTGNLRWYAMADGTIWQCSASLGTPSSGSGVHVALKKNGTQIAQTTIPAGEHQSLFTPSDEDCDFNEGAYFTVDILSVGSGTKGSDLVVEMQIG